MNFKVKNFILIIVIIIVGFVMFKVIKNKNESVAKIENKVDDYITYNKDVYIKYDENKINKDVLENKKSNEILINVGLIPIKKLEFEAYENYPLDYATSELIKRNIGSQEAKKIGITISEKDRKNYYNKAKESYVENNVKISKDEYIESYVNRKVEYDENFLLKSKITDEIMEETLKCDDKEINDRMYKLNRNASIETFEDDVKELGEICELYMICLSKNYEITYF